MALFQTRRETALAAIVAALCLVALFGPAMPQPADYHAFADRRTLLGVPFALDVLSNLAFVAWAAAGLRALSRLPPELRRSAWGAGARLFFAGLAATALGSSWYHLQPTDAGLLVDRLCMSLAFSGLLALAAAERVGERAGRIIAWGACTAGFAAALHWQSSGNIVPWAAFQFGGMALLLAGAALPPVPNRPAVSWTALILIYGVAKGLELADQQAFVLTGCLVSGHTLKHLVAACAAWPVWRALVQASLPARRDRAAEPIEQGIEP